MFVPLLAVACGTTTTTRTVQVTSTNVRTVTITKPVTPPPRVFVPAHGHLEYMPDLIGLGASSAIEQIRWKTYGGPIAVGVGIFPRNDCVPSCAGGHITPVKVTVKLRRRILCRGVLAYDLWAIQGPGLDGTFDVISDGGTC